MGVFGILSEYYHLYKFFKLFFFNYLYHCGFRLLLLLLSLLFNCLITFIIPNWNTIIMQLSNNLHCHLVIQLPSSSVSEYHYHLYNNPITFIITIVQLFNYSYYYRFNKPLRNDYSKIQLPAILAILILLAVHLAVQILSSLITSMLSLFTFLKSSSWFKPFEYLQQNVHCSFFSVIEFW